MSHEAKDIFSAEPVDLIKEREEWHRMNRPKASVPQLQGPATPQLDIWLGEFDRFILSDDNFVLQAEEGTVHIPAGLVERMFQFLQGGLE